jgi:hypothetical protein
MTRLLLAILLVTPALAVAEGEPPGHPVPAEVRDASAHLKEWLNSFRGKSEADVAKVIGNEYQKDSWQFQGKKELKIRYKIDKESMLDLYFRGDKVVRAGIITMSETRS